MGAREMSTAIRSILIAGMLVAAATLPAAAASHSGPSSPGHTTTTTATPDRGKGLPLPRCTYCRQNGCTPVCQGSGATMKCWWSCPKSKS